MRFLDMLFLSASNLLKRKVRTVLTVLGVVIGVASIVVMVSLGLGLSKSIMDEMANYTSLTAVNVTEGDTSSSNWNDRKYLTDKLVKEISDMEHVLYVAPALSMQVVAKFGAYTNKFQLYATSLQYIHDQNIEVESGKLPAEEDKDLELFFGNMIQQNFMTKNGKGYWETGVLPDVDLMEDSIMYILDTEHYYTFHSGGSDSFGTPVKAPKKYLFKAAGVAAGGT